MLPKFRKFIQSITEPGISKMLLSMRSTGYLYEIGWFNSVKSKKPVDLHNNPLPWVTYPFIDFISERLKLEMDIFEFGSGNSTLFYSGKVRTVTAVENDKKWFDLISGNIPENVSLEFINLETNGRYSHAAYYTGKKFDIIIVDGRDRVNCIKNSISSLKKAGIIILDNSERKEYQEGVEFLRHEGFKSIDFWGIVPGLFYKMSTTVFYRSDNCINL
jgi:precorrin-6B methylase 2